MLARRATQEIPVLADFSKLEVPPHELKAAIILFYSLLNEQQRRLYAGQESIRLGRGSDTRLADFLASIPIRLHKDDNSCWIKMSRSAACVEMAPDGNR
jgi:hypothetical protein